MKKILSLILAAAIILSLNVCAFADETDELPEEPAGEVDTVPEEQDGEAPTEPDAEEPAEPIEPTEPDVPQRLYQFDDVTPDKWYYTPVIYLYENGSIKGEAEHYYGADHTMTVGQTMVILSRVLLGSESGATWGDTMRSARSTLINKGIISAASFPADKLESSVTRYQLAEIVSGYLSYTGYDVDETILSFLYSFSDLDSQHKAAVNHCYVAGVMEGVGNNLFAGGKGLSRAEGAMIIYRLLNPGVRSDYTGFKNYNKLLGSFVTTLNASNVNRTFNVKRAADTLCGTVLAPGATFSFNKIVGDANQANGYKLAPVIIGGQSVPGYGGGVCQAATTVYNAAFNSDLKIVERHAHGLRSSYVAGGMDATIAYGSYDLKFSNPYNYNIKVFEYVAGNAVFAGIYGPDEITVPKVTYSISRNGSKYTTYRYANGVNDFTTVSNYK